MHCNLNLDFEIVLGFLFLRLKGDSSHVAFPSSQQIVFCSLFSNWWQSWKFCRPDEKGGKSFPEMHRAWSAIKPNHISLLLSSVYLLSSETNYRHMLYVRNQESRPTFFIYRRKEVLTHDRVREPQQGPFLCTKSVNYKRQSKTCGWSLLLTWAFSKWFLVKYSKHSRAWWDH